MNKQIDDLKKFQVLDIESQKLIKGGHTIEDIIMDYTKAE